MQLLGPFKTGFLSGFSFEPPTRDTLLRVCHLRGLNSLDSEPFLRWPSLLVPNDADIEQQSRSVFLIVLLTHQLQSLLPVLVHYFASA